MARRLLSVLALSLLCSTLSLVPALAQAAERTDLLDLASGALVLEGAPEYTSEWSSMQLLDGAAGTGWCSPKEVKAPFTFLIELAQVYRLDAFAVDNSTTEEGSYPGISARTIELWGSTQSTSEGFAKFATVEAPKGERGEFQLPTPTQVRWLRVVVVDNWGDASYTEMMELEAYGTPVGKPGERPSIDGVFDTNYGLMRLRQDGTTVTGCYDWDGGELRGSTDGRVLDFEWREKEEDGVQIGTAVLVLSDEDVLNGLWYEGGALKGHWRGPRAQPGQAPKCTPPGEASLAEALTSGSGRAILYGIYFDSDKAVIKAESEAALQQLLGALRQQPQLKVTIEGHTDAQASEAHNQALSQRRAEAVRAWLLENGIDAGRLQAKGLGESQPVADNDTPQGRRLNRRVEIVAGG